jgi:hypothetical protein
LGLLEYRVGLAALFAVEVRNVLLAAKDDTLKEENVILAVDLGLCDGENVVEEQVSEMGYVVALPVVDALCEVLDGLNVLRAALGLVDLVRDAFGCGGAFPEFVIVRIAVGRRRLDE